MYAAVCVCDCVSARCVGAVRAATEDLCTAGDTSVVPGPHPHPAGFMCRAAPEGVGLRTRTSHARAGAPHRRRQHHPSSRLVSHPGPILDPLYLRLAPRFSTESAPRPRPGPAAAVGEKHGGFFVPQA